MSDALDTVPAHLREILDRIPTEPGVYLMKDKKGRVVYVGKAASLRARVRQYFTRSGDTRDFVPLLGRLLGDIETVVTNNEKEALLLENNLIKQHQPRFNVKLVDDKNYLVLRLDPTKDYPRLEVTRRIGQDGARYFGPYHSATSVRAALKVVNRHFKLRTCTDHVLATRQRPCLQYQIKRCDAPCVFPVPVEEYAEQVRDVTLFLDGKDSELVDRLRTRMKQASDAERYESAAQVRDQIAALQRTLEEQRVVQDELRDQDVVGFYREADAVEIAVLFIRGGKLVGRRTFSFSDQEFPDEEIVSSFVGLYYDMGAWIPDEVLLHCNIDDAAVKQEWLKELRDKQGARPGTMRRFRRGKRVDVLAPQRGDRAHLVELAMKNAAASFHSRRDKARDRDEALAKLEKRLGLRRTPRRIECFDISHLQGVETVASMVVFVDGEPAKAEYRRFKVRLAGNDDFASMYEVLSRRLRRSVGADDGERTWPVPDLLVIDGGKGQLGSALAALRDVNAGPAATQQLQVDVVSLAKEREDVAGEKHPDRVFLPRIKDPLLLKPNSAELHLLSAIRDEAHRFAITFNRERRRRRTLRSGLSDVPGIGAKRARELLRHFGSLKKVREASPEALAAVPGMSRAAADAVVKWFAAEPAAMQQEDVATQQPVVETVRPARARGLRSRGRKEAPSPEAVAEDAAGAELAALLDEIQLPDDAPVLDEDAAK